MFPESFIEVSEEEFKQEDDQLVIMRNKGSPDDVHKDGTRKGEKTEESSTQVSSDSDSKEEEEEEERKTQTEEKELKESTEAESSCMPAANEWEHFDVVSLAGGWGLSAVLCLRLCVCVCSLCCRMNWRLWRALCRRSRAA